MKPISELQLYMLSEEARYIYRLLETAQVKNKAITRLQLELITGKCDRSNRLRIQELRLAGIQVCSLQYGGYFLADNDEQIRFKRSAMVKQALTLLKEAGYSTEAIMFVENQVVSEGLNC